tara:strand:- start:194 stop:463 length:270 start_codon:yes stop_codon:yes gene_type:complete
MNMDKDVLMQLLIMQNPQLAPILEMMNNTATKEALPKKRKVSAYSRRYGAAYKRLRRKHTLKSGKMRKGINHKKLVKMAHKEAKRGGKR